MQQCGSHPMAIVRYLKQDKLANITGCPKKNKTPCSLNILVTKYLIFKSFFLLKTETHSKISNTKPFLCDIKGPRNVFLKQINSYSCCLILAQKPQNLQPAASTGPRWALIAPRWLLVCLVTQNH